MTRAVPDDLLINFTWPKAVLRGSFDQSNDIVLVAPQKCLLAEVLPVRQNEIV